MIFDSTMLARIAADLRRVAMGARVDRVFASTRQEIVLDLRRKLPREQIVLSWSAEFGRMHMCTGLTPKPDLNLPIADVLRKHLRGSTLIDCRQVAFDRILRLDFANCVGLGPASRATLVAEIMGRHANLILLDEDETIIGCAKHIDITLNRYRETLPGIPYTPPPFFDRVPPGEATAEMLAQKALAEPDSGLRKFIRGTLMGASDLFLDELAARTQLDDEAVVEMLPDGWVDLLCAQLEALLGEAYAEGPGYLYSAPGRPGDHEFAYPFRLQSSADLDTQPTDDLSAAVEGLVHHKQVGRLVQERSERLSGFAQRALKKALGRERERRNALKEAEEAEGLRRRGELILANLHLIHPGAAEVTVTDYYEPDQPQVVLPLDPNYSAKQNAQALFDRYKRAKRIQDRVPGLLRRARIEREYLQGLLQQVLQADSLDDLDQLEQELARGDYIGEQAKRRRKPPTVGGVEPRRWATPDGYPVLYGKTGSQNDAVIRAANANDLWFHVKNGPGGHVLIRTNGRPDDVPEEAILAAAGLAAHLSHWRTDSRADVNYTEARHLHKPKGAPPGFVTFRHFSTVTVEPRAPE